MNRATSRSLHVVKRKHLILQHGATQDATVREANGQSIHGARSRSIIYETICTKATNAVEPLAGMQVAFGNGHHLANGAPNRRNCGIVVKDRAADSRGDLK